MNSDYRGRRATIMGLGHFGGGAAAARWLARQGAIVTVTDLADAATLADSLPLLTDVPIAALHLGGHREEDFRDADFVVVNPAVRPKSPWLQVARRCGARLCTEIELFVENCPAKIIGVTGSNGKSTTAAMIASILKARGGESHFRGENTTPSGGASLAAKIGTVPYGRLPVAGRQTFLGGNIGGSLLAQLPQIGPDDWVVLEVSSFQLWHAGPAAKMPHVAVVTGCTPNHLDWHENFADYVAAKQRILARQTPADFAVLNTFDAEAASWSCLVRGRPIPLPGLDDLPPLCVPGEHNRINAACAAAAAGAAGCGREDVRRGLQAFRPLPQRLEWFAVIDGRRFYNDSTATTPESTIAALRSLDLPIWLVAGGKNKGADFETLAEEIVRRTRGAAFFGAAREELHALVAERASHFTCTAVETMEAALRWCWPQSRPGDAVVLSPACASTDQFRNFRQRGERFVELIRQLSDPLNR